MFHSPFRVFNKVSLNLNHFNFKIQSSNVDGFQSFTQRRFFSSDNQSKPPEAQRTNNQKQNVERNNKKRTSSSSGLFKNEHKNQDEMNCY
jgi:hypothetical protein